ncbi:putative 1-aminocyclopropane-1-carboxylate oxidase [Corchorus olitorius]|uniref:1-aminocyclopropane-1-carboxylate oxidase n=1 Tax=Corchorus olitorius TaxID=93759 RepID=A0A1R3HHR4_9ROSI|nr:putative 1-aminocyclopropane-1-carboxylate oxidase [Corchorus olitorius]
MNPNPKISNSRPKASVVAPSATATDWPPSNETRNKNEPTNVSFPPFKHNKLKLCHSLLPFNPQDPKISPTAYSQTPKQRRCPSSYPKALAFEDCVSSRLAFALGFERARCVAGPMEGEEER